jgi:ribonuclease HI
VTIVAAADGSALGNPGPAGWAWYVDDERWAAGGWPHGTNNQGELMAVIDLFASTAHLQGEDLHILCDSQYVINTVTKWMPGWKRKGWRKADGKPVLNLELLKQLDAAIAGRTYTFEWVKGHAGHELNEAADERARAAATAYQKRTPIPTGPGWPEAPSRAAVAEKPADLGLFDGVGDDLFEDLAAPSAERPATELIVDLERELLEAATSADPGRVAVLLHPDFEEIGSSGLWDRDAAIQSLDGEAAVSAGTDIEVLGTDSLGEDTVLLTYRSSSARGSALRSSLWQRVDGQWRLRFRQDTPEG